MIVYLRSDLGMVTKLEQNVKLVLKICCSKHHHGLSIIERDCFLNIKGFYKHLDLLLMLTCFIFCFIFSPHIPELIQYSKPLGGGAVGEDLIAFSSEAFIL